MSELNAATLKEIVNKLPDDYVIRFDNEEIIYVLSDRIKIDISRKELIFTKY